MERVEELLSQGHAAGSSVSPGPIVQPDRLLHGRVDLLLAVLHECLVLSSRILLNELPAHFPSDAVAHRSCHCDAVPNAVPVVNVADVVLVLPRLALDSPRVESIAVQKVRV